VKKTLAYAALILAATSAVGCGGTPTALKQTDARPDTGGSSSPGDAGTSGDAGISGDSAPAKPADAAADAMAPGGDATPPGPDGNTARAMSWAGVYDSDGVWDLSGPITAQRTLGDVVADLLVDEIVKRAGVPSLLEDKARDVVHDLIAKKVKDAVDGNAPALLKPDSELMKKLAAVLATTEVKSTIELTEGAKGAVRGSEELRSLTFSYLGMKSSLPIGDLLERTVPLVTLGADLKGKETAGATLALESHDYALRLGKLVLWVVINVIKEQTAPSLSQAAAAVVDCNAITATLLDGKDKLSFGVGIASFSVSPTTLLTGCNAASGLVKDKVLGLFDVDAGVQLGGDVQYADEDGDALADRLKSKTGYGGLVTATPLPAALAPRVTARFEATRRKAPRPPAGFAPIYADMSNTLGTTARLPLRGRIIQVADRFDPATTTAFAQLSQEELPSEVVTVTTDGASPVMLGMVTTDGEGYVDRALDIGAAGLAAGNHGLRFLVRGRVAGTASARLLAPGAAGVVVRSDVDLTYLDTDFMSATGKLKLLVDRGADRAALPAMEALYRGLRRGAGSTDDVPLSFLSGSPNFFKMVLEEKMRLDQIAQDGVVLKPFKDIIAAKVTDVDLAGVVPALEEQVGYKLTALLRLRLEVPADTREILMGDDSEADAVAYLLYHQLTSKQLGAEALLAKLDEVKVDATWKTVAADLIPKVVAVLPAEPPVIAIYINRTGKPNARFPVASWTVPQLTRYHTGAWPLALDLFEEGRLSGPATAAVKARLRELGQSAADLSAAAQAAVSAGFLRAETVAAFP
jgi:hypothetical protein